jgi:hypothetical protein
MVSNAVRCLVLVVVVGCAGSRASHVATDSDLPPANCPKLTGSYMSFVIDDQRATINVPKFQFSEAPIFYPSVNPDDILSITPLSPSEAARWYRPCPGVEVIMIRTKAGNWRPDIPSRR